MCSFQLPIKHIVSLEPQNTNMVPLFQSDQHDRRLGRSLQKVEKLLLDSETLERELGITVDQRSV